MQEKRTKERAILMVVGLVPDKLGAYERFMASLSERCQQKGCRVDFLLAGDPLPEIQTALFRSGSTIHVMDDWDKGSLWRQVRRFVAKSARLLREERYDLISFSFCEPLSVLFTLAWARIFLPKEFRPRTVWHQHSEQQRPRGFLEKHCSVLRMVSWFMDGVCPVYKAATRTMQERGITPSKISVLGNGTARCALPEEVVAAKRNELGAKPSDFVLFAAASLIERKNIPMMLRAFACALAKMPNLLLVIAGEGPLEPPLKELARELKVEPRLRFLGRRNDIAELCSAADLCLVTSQSEALPFFCIETFAAHRTIIATPAGGVPEIVQDGVNGVIVGFDDFEALSQEILRVAQDSELRHTYEEAAGATYLAGYTLDQMVEGYLGLYCQFLG